MRNEPAKPRPKQNFDPRAREKPARGTQLSPERLDRIREATIAYAGDHDEFGGVEIRALTGLGSGVMSRAFELLRQEGTIRFARREGNRKWYRLTQDVINRQAAPRSVAQDPRQRDAVQ